MSNGKWIRFTEAARLVVMYAQEEARRFHSEEVSPEHLLLGLLRNDERVAGRILMGMGLNLSQFRLEVEQSVPIGEGVYSRDMRLTEASKRVIDHAYEESQRLHTQYIGTEHLLLGILGEEECLARHLLNDADVTLDLVRTKVEQFVHEKYEEAPSSDS